MISRIRPGLFACVPEGVPLVAGLEDQVAGPGLDHIVAEQAPIWPSRSKLYSSSRVCRCSRAASARGDIGCSTSEEPLAVFGPPASWRSIEDSGERLEAALRALYGYYARLQPLVENIQRDAPMLPILHEMSAYRVRYLEDGRELLLEGWPAVDTRGRGFAARSATPRLSHLV